VDGKIVGGASIEPKKGKQAHVVVLGIFIKEGFRNIGLGTQLIETLIEIACRRGFEIIELVVFSSNKRALLSTKKLGSKGLEGSKMGSEFPTSHTRTAYIWCFT